MKNEINISDNYRESLIDNLSVLFPECAKKLTTTVAAMIFSFYLIFIGSHFHLVKANITISSSMIKPLTATFYIIFISLQVFRFIVVYTRAYF
jgi:hypothetical protein